MADIAVPLLVAFAVTLTGYFVENSPTFVSLKAGLRGRTVPAQHVDTAKAAKLLKSLHLLEPMNTSKSSTTSDMAAMPERMPYAANSQWRYPDPFLSLSSLFDLARSRLRFARCEETVQATLPVVSVILPEAHLKDLQGNWDARGYLWERRAELSLYDGADVQFCSTVGVRLHGGDYKRASSSPSLRIYCRRQYGKRAFRAAAVPWTLNSDIDEVVLRKDHAFITPLAFDLSSRIGAVVPPYTPVLLYVNGRSQGLYTLTRRAGSELASELFDDRDIVCFQYKGKKDGRSRKAYEHLHRWLAETPSPLSMSDAAAHVDLDNYSRHILSTMFCGTNDGRQGTAVRLSDGKWRWINWDMDQSFVDLGASLEPSSNLASERAGVELLTYGRRWYADQDRPIAARDFRSLLFLRLCEESPEFRKFFSAAAHRVLSEDLRQESIRKIVEHYERHLPSLTAIEQADFASIADKLKQRSHAVRSQVQRYLRE